MGTGSCESSMRGQSIASSTMTRPPRHRLACAFPRHVLFCRNPGSMDCAMSIFRSVGVALAAAIAAALTVGPAIGQTSIWFSLDGKFEGPSAPLLVAIDRGYFQAEGLGVAIDTADNFQDPIKRLAPGGYDMALGDLSTLIRFRDANPASAIKAVFIVTNRPAFAIVSRRSRGVEKPKDLEGKILG